MNQAQQDMLSMCGNDIFMMYSTHETNPYNIKLTTLMVADSNYEGLPVVLLVSITETEATLTYFLQVLKQQVSNISPKSFMFDDAPAYFIA